MKRSFEAINPQTGIPMPFYPPYRNVKMVYSVVSFKFNACLRPFHLRPFLRRVTFFPPTHSVFFLRILLTLVQTDTDLLSTREESRSTIRGDRLLFFLLAVVEHHVLRRAMLLEPSAFPLISFRPEFFFPSPFSPMASNAILRCLRRGTPLDPPFFPFSVVTHLPFGIPLSFRSSLSPTVDRVVRFGEERRRPS